MPLVGNSIFLVDKRRCVSGNYSRLLIIVRISNLKGNDLLLGHYAN